MLRSLLERQIQRAQIHGLDGHRGFHRCVSVLRLPTAPSAVATFEQSPRRQLLSKLFQCRPRPRSMEVRRSAGIARHPVVVRVDNKSGYCPGRLNGRGEVAIDGARENLGHRVDEKRQLRMEGRRGGRPAEDHLAPRLSAGERHGERGFAGLGRSWAW